MSPVAVEAERRRRSRSDMAIPDGITGIQRVLLEAVAEEDWTCVEWCERTGETVPTRTLQRWSKEPIHQLQVLDEAARALGMRVALVPIDPQP
jgi:hypothetical protein